MSFSSDYTKYAVAFVVNAALEFKKTGPETIAVTDEDGSIIHLPVLTLKPTINTREVEIASQDIRGLPIGSVIEVRTFSSSIMFWYKDSDERVIEVITNKAVDQVIGVEYVVGFQP